MCKKTTKLAILGFIAVLFLIALVMAVTGRMDMDSRKLAVKTDVIVEDGMAYPDALEKMITINKSGTYEYIANWVPDTRGMVTGFSITNEEGKCVLAFSAEYIDMQSKLELEKGTYNVKFDFLTSAEEWKQFLEDNSIPDTKKEEYPFAESGRWQMEYNLSFANQQSEMGMIGLWGFLFGFAVIAFFVILLMKGESGTARYDERQELVQGRAFRGGFWTMMFSAILLIWLNLFGVIPFVGMEVALLTVGMVSATVYAVYCVWNDAYFALNEGGNHTAMVSVIFLLGISNLIMGLNAILDGEMLVDGMLTFLVAHFLVAMLAFGICGTYLLKKFLWDRKEEQS